MGKECNGHMMWYCPRNTHPDTMRNLVLRCHSHLPRLPTLSGRLAYNVTLLTVVHTCCIYYLGWLLVDDNLLVNTSAWSWAASSWDVGIYLQLSMPIAWAKRKGYNSRVTTISWSWIADRRQCPTFRVTGIPWKSRDGVETWILHQLRTKRNRTCMLYQHLISIKDNLLVLLHVCPRTGDPKANRKANVTKLIVVFISLRVRNKTKTVQPKLHLIGRLQICTELWVHICWQIWK